MAGQHPTEIREKKRSPHTSRRIVRSCLFQLKIGTLISEVTRGVRGGRSLAPLLVAPAAYPLLVAAAAVNDGLTRGSSILNPLLLLVAADLVLAVIGVITAEPLEETAR